MMRYCSCTTHRPFGVLMRKQLKTTSVFSLSNTLTPSLFQAAKVGQHAKHSTRSLIKIRHYTSRCCAFSSLNSFGKPRQPQTVTSLLLLLLQLHILRHVPLRIRNFWKILSAQWPYSSSRQITLRLHSQPYWIQPYAKRWPSGSIKRY